MAFPNDKNFLVSIFIVAELQDRPEALGELIRRDRFELYQRYETS